MRIGPRGSPDLVLILVLIPVMIPVLIPDQIPVLIPVWLEYLKDRLYVNGRNSSRNSKTI